MKEVLHEHHGLEGVRGGKLKGVMRRSVSAMLTGLRHYRLVSAAGDHGCVTVWRDDTGMYRCGFYRYMAAIDEKQWSNKTQVRKWLAKWFPKMRSAV